MPRVVKSDATREPFDEAKLRSGMLKALEKRPVASEAVDAAVNHVCHKLRTLGEREVPARLIGELVMDELHQLDEVAYVRFASVYRSFQDVDAFREEIERLRHRRPRSAEDVQLGLWTQRREPPRATPARSDARALDRRRPPPHGAGAASWRGAGLYSTPPNPARRLRAGRAGGQVVGEGWHQRAGEPHAEVVALHAAGGARARRARPTSRSSPARTTGARRPAPMR